MPAAAETKIFNISELARGFNLDRATVRKRIEAAGIAPLDRKAKETRYRLDDNLEQILLAADADLDAEKLRKLKAEANLKEMEVQVRRGELAPVQDFQEIVQALFGGLYKEIAVRFPKKVGSRMARAKTAADASAVLARELDQIFLSVRADFTKHLDNGKAGAAARTEAKRRK